MDHMEIKLIKEFSAVLIIALFFTVSCARNIKEYRLETNDAKYDFIFASNSSEFKDNIRNKLIARYRNQANIDIVNISKLNDIKARDYDVILIMDTCMGGTRLNRSLNAFINRPGNNKNTVLLITAGDSDWKYSNNDIDAITSASKIENEDLIFTEISQKIDRIISDKNN